MSNKNTHQYTVEFKIDGTEETLKDINKYLLKTLNDDFTEKDEIVYDLHIKNIKNLKENEQ